MTYGEWWSRIVEGFRTADYSSIARALAVSLFLGLIIGSLFLLRRDSTTRRKGRWALVILLIPFVGPLIYLRRPETGSPSSEEERS